jgi:cytidine deaminase
MVKAISEVRRAARRITSWRLKGTQRLTSDIPTFNALVVTSAIPRPSTSPCGICRQFLNEFLEPETPIYIVASTYPSSSSSAPEWLSDPTSAQAQQYISLKSMDQLLPDAFGPKQLAGE